MKDCDKYIYLIERFAVRKNSLIDYEHINGVKTLPLICYHVTTNEKYPFIEFLLEKNPNNNLELPFIRIDSDTEDINYLIEKHIKDKLRNLYLDYNQNKTINIKGLINDSSEKIYALVDISDFIIQYAKYNKTIDYCFTLPSEIINCGNTYDISIDENTRQTFYDLPELGLLYEPISKKPYPLPDAVYSFSPLAQTEINSVLGPNKDSINRYFYFYFNIQFNNSTIFNNHVRYGINKYALFPENFTIHIESDNTLSLTNDELNEIFKIYKQLYVQYIDNNANNSKVDIIVRDYNDIVPLSYFEIVGDTDV